MVGCPSHFADDVAASHGCSGNALGMRRLERRHKVTVVDTDDRLTADTPGERYDAIRRGIQFIAARHAACRPAHNVTAAKTSSPADAEGTRNSAQFIIAANITATDMQHSRIMVRLQRSLRRSANCLRRMAWRSYRT